MEYLATVPVGVDGQGIEAHLAAALEAAGLTVYRSFSLREALVALPQCGCRCHGTDSCTCTYTVLLAYGGHQPPVLVAIHGRDGLLQLQVLGGDRTPGTQERVLAALRGAVDISQPSQAQ